MQVSPANELQEIEILPSKGWLSLELGDLWRYRELFYFLAWRDIKVRYKQTALGAAWAILQPLLTMGLFSLIFGYFLQLPSGGSDDRIPCAAWRRDVTGRRSSRAG